MASNQLSNKKGKHDGSQGQTGRRSDSASQQSTADYGSMSQSSRQEAGYVEQGAEQFRELTRDHEGTAVAVALATGFGIGLVIGCALASGHERPRTWRDRLSAEGIGRQVLDRLEGMIPDALAEYIRK